MTDPSEVVPQCLLELIGKILNTTQAILIDLFEGDAIHNTSYKS